MTKGSTLRFAFAMAAIRASSGDWLPPKGCFTVCVIVWISQNEDVGSKDMKSKKTTTNVPRKRDVLIIVFSPQPRIPSQEPPYPPANHQLRFIIYTLLKIFGSVDFRKYSSTGRPLMSARKTVDRSKNWWNILKGLKIFNDNWWGHAYDLPFFQGVPLGLAYWLRTVIDRTTPENRRILPWGTRGTGYVPRGDKAQGGLIVSTCFKKRNQREDNHINL